MYSSCSSLTCRAFPITADNFQYYGNGQTLSCTSQDVKFDGVSGFNVLDSGSSVCNCDAEPFTCPPNDQDPLTGECPACPGSEDPPVSCMTEEGTKLPYGTIFGGCTGTDDTITMSVLVDLTASNAERYDVGVYISTDGGSVLDNGSKCLLFGINEGEYNGILFFENESGAATDFCLDKTGGGTYVGYPLPDITLSCIDSDGDGFLDFDMGISWDTNPGTGQNPDLCTFEYALYSTDPKYVPPFPGTGAKCWHSTSAGQRITVGGECAFL